ncbi:MAG: TIGR00730 family Rossman fold protein [Alphaproteobacteria bacterium]|nr:TIGR00730 family Rossman fold protein [Alphaproteobacteria bacterium]
MIKSLCIFCGSRHGTSPKYHAQAARLGELCGQYAVDVVYGGGHVGLMGVVADTAMAAGGTVRGLIPERLLKREVGHPGISELIVTENMFDRKDRMIAESDAFAVLPGGLGTLDELFEVLTLRQLGYHRKPIVLVNVDGFWDPLNTLIRQVVEHDFADADVYPMMQIVQDADAVLPALGIDEDGGDTEPLRRAAP